MPPKKRESFSTDKGKVENVREKRKGAHVPGGRKKQKNTWVPATQRQKKAAKLREAIRPHQGRSRNLWETAAFCFLVCSLCFAHADGSLALLAHAGGHPQWSRFIRFGADLVEARSIS